MTFFTIGHSTRSGDELVALLEENGVGELADVRGIPRSRRHPQFDSDALARLVTARGIAYHHVAELGGRRKASGVPAEVNGLWQNQSFHNYADHALTPEFAAGLTRLMELGRRAPCAILCAEAVWWRCHRRIVADHLLHRGERVAHILGPGKVQPATLTPGATADASGRLIYPAPGRAEDPPQA